MENRTRTTALKRSITLNSAVDVWSRGIIGRIQATLGRQRSRNKILDAASSSREQLCWEEIRQQSSAFAVLGRRPRMEDRYIIEENINNNTDISFFAVFDGHGGEFAADYAKDILVKNIYKKVIEAAKLLSNPQKPQHLSTGNGGSGDDDGKYDASPFLKRKAVKDETNKENDTNSVRRRDSLRKSHSSTTDDCTAPKQKASETDVITVRLNSILREGPRNIFLLNSNNNNNNINKDGLTNNNPPQTLDAKVYLENGKINFGKLITDEVLSADYNLVEAAKKKSNISGTTALIAIIHGTKLFVANVGDSRGVMYDSRGIAIPLSFDHKPQQVRERKRIHEAGGFIAFRGVWRVAGVLATSRALGDYPLKDKNLVIANPDILTFDLNDHKPSFLILASDGLWDTFSNEEACTFIKKHISEPDYGAKSLAMQSYYRGSVDNITVLIIVFRKGVYRISSSVATTAKSASTASATVVGEQINTAQQAKEVASAPNIHRSNSGVGTGTGTGTK
ncbi:probable protein phosphatase CG10417 isoform X2 [Teleopsis dalmanni]|uniref:probable protein phosphatase CG10417 isoform X2 n=1 Tax=Teleopsis dalmanni TaxID=139649 RepID=UPI0018CEA6AB|nr:probable protein phosphatase CG10417 isoform X2 [Teleopsis dalmanni]